MNDPYVDQTDRSLDLELPLRRSLFLPPSFSRAPSLALSVSVGTNSIAMGKISSKHGKKEKVIGQDKATYRNVE